MFNVKGRCKSTAEIDESFVLVGSLLDDQLVDKIKQGKYVNFAKLIPKDRIAIEEDDRMEWVTSKRYGMYLAPVSQRESTTISKISGIRPSGSTPRFMLLTIRVGVQNY